MASAQRGKQLSDRPESGAAADRSSTARSGASRMRILQALRNASTELGVQELADQIGLHVNTVRFHLERLLTDGLVERAVEDRTEPGRPRLTYRAAEQPDRTDDQRSYRLLAEILASYLSGAMPDPRAAAIEAGRTWGRYLTESPAPYRSTDEETAVRELLRMLDEIGFQPELAQGPDGSAADTQQQIRLRHCPFLEVAGEHRDVVCAVHLGLMQGALTELRAPLRTDRLEPFVEPSLCLATLQHSSVSEPEDH